MASVICWSKIAGKKYNNKEINRENVSILWSLKLKNIVWAEEKKFFSPKRQEEKKFFSPKRQGWEN